MQASIRGLLAEMFVQAHLTERGYIVSIPPPHAPYDLVAESPDHILYRIQVKRAWMNGTQWFFHPTNGQGPYPDEVFDYLAVVLMEESEVLFIPWEAQYKGHQILVTDELRCYTELP